MRKRKVQKNNKTIEESFFIKRLECIECIELNFFYKSKTKRPSPNLFIVRSRFNSNRKPFM